MKDWVKINQFERIHQAELRKDILEQYNIESAIIPKKDSAFLLGVYELFVEKENAERAKFLIKEFSGLTKVNSYYKLRPVQIIDEILKEHNLETKLLTKSEEAFLLDNYELYVNKSEFEKAQAVLKHIQGWTKINSYEKLNQTSILVDMLYEEKIEAILTINKDSNYHIEEICLWVKENEVPKAKQIISEMKGWTRIITVEKYHKVELFEAVLEQNEIRHFVEKHDEFSDLHSKFSFWVKDEEQEEAINVINESKEWQKVRSFVNIYPAEIRKKLLEENAINAVIIKKKDSAFLLGDIELFVEIENTKRAFSIIEEFEKNEFDHEEWKNTEYVEEEIKVDDDL